MASERHEQIVALGKEPISDAGPVGDPVRYQEIFERLQAQMDRIGSLSGEEVEWGQVVELATEILKSKSKDLLVMTYLTIGLLEHDGYAGLAAGFEAYREFLGKFWDSCFPKVKPPHGRYNAVQYLADKILPQIELKAGKCKKQPTAAEKEAVHQCAALVEEVDKAVGQAFSSQPDTPNLLTMSRAFRALKAKVGPLVAEAPAEAAPAAAGAPGMRLTAAAEGVPETFATATQAVQAIVRVAKYLLSQDNKDPRGYRLMRAVHFGGLADTPKDKLLPPPPPARRQFFENTVSGGNWPTLLTEAEGQFASTPLWLDLQRYVATALNGLGPAYAAAKHAVTFETVALHARLPELFDRSFKDGNPFADGATKAWLNEARGELGGGGGGAAGADALAKATSEARKLLSQAKAPEAIARLAEQMDTSGSRRERSGRSFALAGFCLDMKKLTLAGSLLEGLEAVIDQYHLEEWEPDLAAQAVRNLYECLRKAKPKPTPDDVRRNAAVFARLCRLDPAAALKLDATPAK